MSSPNTVQILEAYWKEHPAWFGRTYGEYLHLGANQEMLRLVLKDTVIDPKQRVLDVSTGLGGNARWLASLYGVKVDAVDRFKPAIVCARQLAKAQGVGELCQFAVQTGPELPFSPGIFDLAVTAEDESAWPEVARVLKPGGIVVGSQVAGDGVRKLEASLAGEGFEIQSLIDVTDYALAFYRAKEAEAKLLLNAGLMRQEDVESLQMYTVDLYDAGGASHVLFRLAKK
ncbi:MAG: class I SAM-dependent methyltransferase [Myxococcota bacterium]